MGKIVYCLSKKSNQGKSEVILDVQPARGCHYRLKSGVFIIETSSNISDKKKADVAKNVDFLEKNVKKN